MRVSSGAGHLDIPIALAHCRSIGYAYRKQQLDNSFFRNERTQDLRHTRRNEVWEAADKRLPSAEQRFT